MQFVKKILKPLFLDEFTTLDENIQKLVGALNLQHASIESLKQQVLDSKTVQPNSAVVYTFKDLHLTDKEEALYKKLGTDPVYISMVDRMATRALYLLSRDPALTVEKIAEYNGLRAGLQQIVADMVNEQSKDETSNPLTGEVTHASTK